MPEPSQPLSVPRKPLILGVALGIVAIGIAAGVWYMITSRGPDDSNANTSNGNSNSANPIGVVPVVTQPTDADRDGLTDEEEVSANSDPQQSDTDGDGLADLAEVKTYHTNPRGVDSDSDGVKDGEEVQHGYDPNGTGKLLDVGQAIQGLNNQTQ